MFIAIGMSAFAGRTEQRSACSSSRGPPTPLINNWPSASLRLRIPALRFCAEPRDGQPRESVFNSASDIAAIGQRNGSLPRRTGVHQSLRSTVSTQVRPARPGRAYQ